MAKKAATESRVELRPIDGVAMIGGVQRKVRIKDNEILMFKGRQIATISKRPGARIGLLYDVHLSASELKEVTDAVTAARGGVQPAKIQEQVDLSYEIIDEDTDE